MKTISTDLKKSPMKILSFFLSLVLLIASIGGVSNALASEGSVQGQKNNTELTPVYDEEGNAMFVAKSTFYDYYSDSQVASSQGSKPGTIDDGIYGYDGFRQTENSFGKFNTVMMNAMGYNKAMNNPSRYPLYLGLFYSNQPNTSNTDFYYPGKGDSDTGNGATNNVNKNFWLAANSSQRYTDTLYNAATQNLVDDTLDSNGNVTQANGAELLPYFNKDFIRTTMHTDNKSLPLGEVTENVSFPFRTVVDEKTGVTSYKFDSSYDTVRMNAKGQLNYYSSKNQQVYDQKKENGDNYTEKRDVKPGFFPYNSPADSNKSSLNYGFGVKIEIPFIMTKDGKINGQDMQFEFSGDDDVWVFIDDHLALDIGGAHGIVTGSINLADLNSKVSGVKDNEYAFSARNKWYVDDEHIKRNAITDFSSKLKESLSDVTKTHTLTMFYMERGKIESNMMINFNLASSNRLALTNKVDISNVNKALQPATKKVTDKEVFIYDVVDATESKETGKEVKDSPELRTDEDTSYINQFTDNDIMTITQKELANKDRVMTELYDTSWNLEDPGTEISNSEDVKSESTYKNYYVSDDRAEGDAFVFANETKDAGITSLQANYLNKVRIGDIEISKKLKGDPVNEKDEFTFKLTLSNIFGGGSGSEAYEGKYIVDGDEKTAKDGIITLKAGQKAVISGIPVLTEYKMKEILPEDSKYQIAGIEKENSNYISEDGVVVQGTVTEGKETNAFIYTNEQIPVTPPAIETPVPTEKPTPKPTEKPTVPPTIAPPEVEVTIAPAVPKPTVQPVTEAPTIKPTEKPTKAPTEKPTVPPTEAPTQKPTIVPTEAPTQEPTMIPTQEPTVVPTQEPTVAPTEEPTIEPTETPEIVEVEEEVPNEPVEVENEQPAAPVKVVPDPEPAAAPKTGDNANTIFWLFSILLSAGAVIYTGYELFGRKKQD